MSGEMWLVLQLPAVRLLALVLLTCKAPLAAFDALIGLELMAPPIKVPKETLATLTTIMLPVSMLTQAYVSKKFADARPMSIWLLSYKVKVAPSAPTLPECLSACTIARLQVRLAIGVSLVGFVFALRQLTAGGGTIPFYMYGGGLLIMSLSSMVSSAMFVAQVIG